MLGKQWDINDCWWLVVLKLCVSQMAILTFFGNFVSSES